MITVSAPSGTPKNLSPACKVFNFTGEFLGSMSTNSRPDIYGELATQERIAYLSTNRIYIGGIKGDAKQLSIAVK